MRFYKGEKRKILIKFIDENKDAIDVSDYSFSFSAKESDLQPTSEIYLDDSSFDKSEAVSGNIYLIFEVLDEYEFKTNLCQITATSSDGLIYKSKIFNIEILKSI
jgi:hypothetical protein